MARSASASFPFSAMASRRFTRGRLARIDAPEGGVDLEVPPAGQRAVDHRLLEDDAAHPAGGERLLRHVETREPGAAGCRLDRRRQHADRRGLAGPVRAEQAEDLAGRDLEVDAPHGFDAALIRLAELGHFDCVHVTPFGQSQLPRFVRQGDDGFERGDVT